MSDRAFTLLLALGPLMGTGILGFFGRAISKKIDGWDLSIQRNTEALTGLSTRLEQTNSKVDAVEREYIRTMAEVQMKLRKVEGDIETLGERSHGVVNALMTLWGMAKHQGWKMPTEQPEMPTRLRKRDH